MTADELTALVEGIAPVVRDVIRTALADVQTRVQVLETQLAGLTPAVTDLGALRERLAVLETRPPLAGPAGQDGAPGPAGKDGADGTPGLAFRGVYVDGQVYERGELVTHAGSSWHCNAPTTTKPGEGSKAWTLMVKRGRDGKDGAPGPEGPPGRDWQQVYDDTRRGR
jgi:hypothetical protein